MMDIAELRACPPKTLGLDSGFRRRDEFEAPSLFLIPANPGSGPGQAPESAGIKEEFEIYTIMALLVIER